VTLFSVRYDYTPFYEGRVAFWPLYLNAQAVIIGDKLAQAGETFNVISPNRLGVKFVANSVVTTREMLEKHPDTVERFLAALRQGWQDALDPQNEEQAVQVLLQMDRETPAAVVRRQLAVTRDLMLPAPGAAFGTIDLDAWKQTAEIMAAQQLIPPQPNLESVLMTNLIK
jgi:NitT/TauT family transport system substrate-binding protein